MILFKIYYESLKNASFWYFSIVQYLPYYVIIKAKDCKDKGKAIRYNNEFNKTAYDRINLTVPKGNKDKIKAHAEQNGENVNGFINRAIDETTEQDKTKADDNH